MIAIAMYFLSIMSQWINFVFMYMTYFETGPRFRRWWVKPHITEEMRNLFGAYQVLFFYFVENDHEEFYKMTHMMPYQFQALYQLIRHRIIKTSPRRPLSKKIRLFITLNYLSNGDSNQTTSLFFRIGVSTSYKIIDEVCQVIWDCLYPIYLANKDAFEWQLVARGFQRKWNFPNCLGAIDGKEIRIKQPPHSGSRYFNYKKFYSFKLLASCDAYCRFTWIDVGDYGSVSDISAWQNTDFYLALENNEIDLPPNAALPGTNVVMPHCFVGDEIFPQRRYLLKPFARNRGLDERQRNFNYRLSRARNTVEDTFGLWTAKWQILHKSLNFKLSTSTAIVKALTCVHNFLISEELLLNEEDRRYVPENGNREDVNDNINGRQEDLVFAHLHALQQKEILADYFMSEEGALS